MKKVSVEQFSFPVMGAHIEDMRATPDNLFGTASYLNNNIFITAAHSIMNANECDKAGILFRDNLEGPSDYSFCAFEDIELFEDLDIGLGRLKTGHKNCSPLKWSTEGMIMLEDVCAIGYPFGYNSVEKEILPRAFKGQIVTRRSFIEFPKEPKIYELSFHCPKGISGASLRDYKSGKVVGFIIANSSTEILVFEEKEIDKNELKKSIFQKYETTKYGVAIDNRELLNTESRLLGDKFLNYLKRENLT